MSPLSSAVRLVKLSVTVLVPRAGLSSKPARHHISSGEQAIAMGVLMVTILGPSGWVLAHLEDYKKRD